MTLKVRILPFLTTFAQLSARLENILGGWVLVLGIKEGLVECATVCVKSVVILNSFINIRLEVFFSTFLLNICISNYVTVFFTIRNYFSLGYNGVNIPIFLLAPMIKFLFDIFLECQIAEKKEKNSTSPKISSFLYE